MGGMEVWLHRSGTQYSTAYLRPDTHPQLNMTVKCVCLTAHVDNVEKRTVF
jgi:hypothetical protein